MSVLFTVGLSKQSSAVLGALVASCVIFSSDSITESGVKMKAM